MPKDPAAGQWPAQLASDQPNWLIIDSLTWWMQVQSNWKEKLNGKFQQVVSRVADLTESSLIEIN